VWAKASIQKTTAGSNKDGGDGGVIWVRQMSSCVTGACECLVFLNREKKKYP